MITSNARELSPPSQCMGDEISILDGINSPETNLCIWQRSPSADISLELKNLTRPSWPDRRRATSRKSFSTDIRKHLSAHGTEPSELEQFVLDLERIAERFFSISEGLDTKFRLYSTKKDDCRRFHVDHRHLRLICTYQGAGTEWLTNEQVDRDAYDAGLPNSSIIRFGEPSRFKRFWVGILKDDGYPGNAGLGLMHRSPPASDSDGTRIVFCLDACP